jgi:hypothetical protein
MRGVLQRQDKAIIVLQGFYGSWMAVVSQNVAAMANV